MSKLDSLQTGMAFYGAVMKRSDGRSLDSENATYHARHISQVELPPVKPAVIPTPRKSTTGFALTVIVGAVLVVLWLLGDGSRPLLDNGANPTTIGVLLVPLVAYITILPIWAWVNRRGHAGKVKAVAEENAARAAWFATAHMEFVQRAEAKTSDDSNLETYIKSMTPLLTVLSESTAYADVVNRAIQRFIDEDYASEVRMYRALHEVNQKKNAYPLRFTKMDSHAIPKR